MGSQTQIRRRGRLSLILGTLLAAAAFAALAYADDISSDVPVVGSAKVMALNEGGPTGSTQLTVIPTGSGSAPADGKSGCNLTGGTSLTVSVSSSSTAVATVSPTSLTFTSCGDIKTLTVTPVAQGSTNVTLAQTSNTTGATFNFAPAAFRVDVAPPPNTAPNVSVTGVSHGSSYSKGSVPSAGCAVEDAEDGNTTFSATLSEPTGPYASDGLGSQTATCSYTDAGNLTETVTATYLIVDPSAPSIGYTVAPAAPDGNNGWYRTNVSLTWNVSEPDSPNSLVRTGCVDQSVTGDQVETSYPCQATSAGGSTGPVSVSIKRDAHAPSYDCGTLPTGWQPANVTLSCTAADVGPAGLADAADASFQLSTNVANGDEDATAGTSSKSIADDAGNSTTAQHTFMIDRRAPSVVLSSSDDSCSLPGNDGWCRGTQTAGFTASDGGSGLATDGAASRVFTRSSTTQGGTVMIASGTVADVVGNSNPGINAGPYKLDSVNPGVACATPAPTFILGAVGATVSAGVADATSGPAAATVSTSADTSSVGSHSVSLTGYDNAGNSKTVSCSYSVAYLFSGFFAPIDRPNTMNVSKAGQAIPLKWRLTNAAGNPITNLAGATVSVVSLSCALGSTTDLLEEVAAGSSGLQNLGDGYYQINWKSPTSYASSCKSVSLALAGEATPRTALAFINFKK